MIINSTHSARTFPRFYLFQSCQRVLLAIFPSTEMVVEFRGAWIWRCRGSYCDPLLDLSGVLNKSSVFSRTSRHSTSRTAPCSYGKSCSVGWFPALEQSFSRTSPISQSFTLFGWQKLGFYCFIGLGSYFGSCVCICAPSRRYESDFLQVWLTSLFSLKIFVCV